MYKSLYIVICLLSINNYYSLSSMENDSYNQVKNIDSVDQVMLVSKSGEKHLLSTELTALIKQKNSTRKKPIAIDDNKISLDISNENMGIIVPFLEEIKEQFNQFTNTPTTETRYNFLKETHLIKRILSKNRSEKLIHELFKFNNQLGLIEISKTIALLSNGALKRFDYLCHDNKMKNIRENKIAPLMAKSRLILDFKRRISDHIIKS